MRENSGSRKIYIVSKLIVQQNRKGNVVGERYKKYV